MKQHRMHSEIASVAGILCAAALCSHATAQTAGSTTVGVGWLHVKPQGYASPTTIESVGGAMVDQQMPGTRAQISTADTVGITVERYITDNLGVAMLAAIPFKSKLIGDGTLKAYGLLGYSLPLAPIVEARYHFFSAESTFRPLIGLGLNYTRFNNVHVTNAQYINDNYGPGGSARATFKASWNPVYLLAASCAITQHWSINAEINYFPLKSTMRVYGETAAGTRIVTTSMVKFNPVSTLLSAGYTF